MNPQETTPTTFMRPLDEILELLETTRPDNEPVRLRVKPDRRVRNEPPPGGIERRSTI